MKTVDLIPIILYELSYGEKYGYEIIKNIEQKIKWSDRNQTTGAVYCPKKAGE